MPKPEVSRSTSCATSVAVVALPGADIFRTYIGDAMPFNPIHLGPQQAPLWCTTPFARWQGRRRGPDFNQRGGIGDHSADNSMPLIGPTISGDVP